MYFLFVALKSYNISTGIRMQTACLLEEPVITQHQIWGSLGSLGEESALVHYGLGDMEICLMVPVSECWAPQTDLEFFGATP